MRREVELQKGKGLMDGASSSSKTLPTFATLKQTSIVLNRPVPDVTQDKSDWLISEDYSILQVIRDQQGISPSLKILMPSHTPNWDLAADAVNAVSPIYRSAKKCKSRFENVIMMREEGNEVRKQTSHLYQLDSNAAYTSIFLKRCKGIFELAQKRKAQAESVKIQTQTQKIPKGLSVLNDCGINYWKPLSSMEITSNRQERIQREKQKNQPTGVQVHLSKANLQPGSAVAATLAKPLARSIILTTSHGTAAGTFATITKALGQTRVSSISAQKAVKQVHLSKANLQQGSAVAATLAKPLARSIILNTSPGPAAETFATITKALGQTRVSSISAQKAVKEQQTLKQQQQLKRLHVQQQQLKRLHVQQQRAASQPGTKVTVGAAALTVAAGQQCVAHQQVTMKQSRPLTDAEVTQFVKRQKLQQQQKVQVVAATLSLPGIQHTATTLRGKLGVVASAQTTTLPSTTLTTSNVLKGTSAVVEQQQTAAILQQAAASSAGITGQHAVTLAVQATASQAQGQQVQIQKQPSAYYFLVTPQAQVVMPQTSIQQLFQNASTINIAPPVAVQNVPQASSILSPSGTIVQQMPADSTIQSSTHVVMHTVAITNTTPTNIALLSPQTISVQAVIQAARQQQAAAQQQKATPYIMTLHNPPK